MLRLGKVSEAQALGKTWKVSRLELRIVRAFRDWISDRVKRKFDRVDKYFDKLPPEEQVAHQRLESATYDQLDSFSITCPLAQDYLRTEEGMAHFAWLLLREHHPDVTEDEALSVWLELADAGQTQEILVNAQGRLPSSGNPVAPAP